MGKLVIILIIIGIIFFLIKKPKQISNEKDDEKDLILCDKCKTFYTKEEIKKINGKNICKDCYANS